MSKRDKILTLVVVLLFGAAGYVLYSGLFKDQISIVTTAAPDIEANKKTIVDLLPYGSTLDLQKLKSRDERLQINPSVLYTYPSITDDEVGISANELVQGTGATQ